MNNNTGGTATAGSATGSAAGRGMFDGFGASPEAEKDAATVEDTGAGAGEETTTQAQPENTGTEGTETQAQPENTGTEVFAEVNGRAFTSKDEFVKAYTNSSAEGIRLDRLNAEKDLLLAEKEKRILELEDLTGAQTFPGLLSADKEQEAAQLEMLPQHKQTEYILAKREWEKGQADAKVQREQKRTQTAEAAKRVQNVIADNEKEMMVQSDKYPDYALLKPTMSKVIELSPCIANRPETPYLSFWIAYGLNAFSRAQAERAKTAAGAEAAKLKAQAAQRQAGGIPGSGKAPNAKPADGSGSSIVSSWRDRNGAGL